MQSNNNLISKKIIKPFFTFIIVLCIIFTSSITNIPFFIHQYKNSIAISTNINDRTAINTNKLSLNNLNILSSAKIIENSKKHLTTNLKKTKNGTNEIAKLHSSHVTSKKLSRSCNALTLNNIKSLNPHLPQSFKYRAINEVNLKSFLCTRGSLLAEEPYFSTIISTSRDFNLNPLVMFAITGQEQSFVPKNNKHAKKIANNPFNVFNSWQRYNTNIKDSSKIASRTIVNLSKGKPNDIDPFTWINRLYCEDKSWGKAVRTIYNELESNVPYSEE